MIVRGKVKRFGKHHGRRSNWKKAYVTLSEGHELNLYER
jgi:large subunit ribosomal protein L23